MLDGATKMKIGLVVVSSSVFLTAALAYNLGGLAASDAMQRSLGHHNLELHTREEQLKGCASSLRNLKDKNTQQVEGDFNQAKKFIESSIEVQLRSFEEARIDSQDCLDTLKDQETRRMGEEDSSVVLLMLRRENKDMQTSLSTANDTIVKFRKNLRMQVRAMRLELSSLRNQLVTRRTTDKKLHEKEEKDFGAGQRGSTAHGHSSHFSSQVTNSTGGNKKKSDLLGNFEDRVQQYTTEKDKDESIKLVEEEDPDTHHDPGKGRRRNALAPKKLKEEKDTADTKSTKDTKGSKKTPSTDEKDANGETRKERRTRLREERAKKTASMNKSTDEKSDKGAEKGETAKERRSRLLKEKREKRVVDASVSKPDAISAEKAAAAPSVEKSAAGSKDRRNRNKKTTDETKKTKDDKKGLATSDKTDKSTIGEKRKASSLVDSIAKSAASNEKSDETPAQKNVRVAKATAEKAAEALKERRQKVKDAAALGAVPSQEKDVEKAASKTTAEKTEKIKELLKQRRERLKKKATGSASFEKSAVSAEKSAVSAEKSGKPDSKDSDLKDRVKKAVDASIAKDAPAGTFKERFEKLHKSPQMAAKSHERTAAGGNDKAKMEKKKALLDSLLEKASKSKASRSAEKIAHEEEPMKEPKPDMKSEEEMKEKDKEMESAAK